MDLTPAFQTAIFPSFTISCAAAFGGFRMPVYAMVMDVPYAEVQKAEVRRMPTVSTGD
jgi:hypothetical protein